MKWNPGMFRYLTPDFAPLHPGYMIRFARFREASMAGLGTEQPFAMFLK
jgi:hypothetical protein